LNDFNRSRGVHGLKSQTRDPLQERDEVAALCKSIRDDPALLEAALLLFDSSARTEDLSSDDARIRLGTLIDILAARHSSSYP
jgi:hypothetical protein